jgi:hypothetical protein
MRKPSRSFLAVGFLLLLFRAAAAQTETIVSAEKLRLRSAVLSEERELLIAKPEGYEASKEAYPVVFVLDGDLNFPFTAEIARYLAAYRLIPKLLVVGVKNTDRVRDMTPNKPVRPHERYASAGGADRFLKFLADEAIPALERSYRTLPSRTLIGHSLSGLLAVHALLTRPDLFSSIIAISPSLWWNDFEAYPKIQAFYKAHPTIRKTLFVSLADESEKEPERYTQMQEAFEKSAPRGLSVFVQFFKQENHITTAVATTTAALQKVFAAPPPAAKPEGDRP